MSTLYEKEITLKQAVLIIKKMHKGIELHAGRLRYLLKRYAVKSVKKIINGKATTFVKTQDIFDVAKDKNFGMRKKIMTPEKIAEAKKLLENGSSPGVVADKFGISTVTLYKNVQWRHNKTQKKTMGNL